MRTDYRLPTPENAAPVAPTGESQTRPATVTGLSALLEDLQDAEKRRLLTSGFFFAVLAP